MNENKADGDARIPSLDGLRAFGALLVVAGHAYLQHPARPTGIAGLLLSLLKTSQTGVSLFFVLSGFLITRILTAEQEGGEGINLARFYMRRVLRIFPAYYAFLFLLWLLAASGIARVTRRDFICAAAYIWNYARTDASPWLGHCWSLCVEEQFYAVWPIMLAACGARRLRWVAAAILAAAPLIRVGTYLLLPTQRSFIPTMFHTRIDALMYGCLGGLLYGERRFQGLLRRCWGFRLHIVSAVLLFAAKPLAEHLWRGGFMLPLGYSMDGLCALLIILWSIEHPRSPVGRILNSPPAVHLGTLSYSLYLWQQVFLMGGAGGILGRFPWNLAGSLCAAQFSYTVIEKPFLALRRRFV